MDTLLKGILGNYLSAWRVLPCDFVSSANLAKVLSAPSSRSLMRMLNRIRPSNNPWGIPLVTMALCHWSRPYFSVMAPVSLLPFFFNPSNIPEWLIPCLVRSGERGIADWALFWCLYSCKEVKRSVERLV